MTMLILLYFLLSLAESNAQTTTPYLEFRGVNLSNNSYVDLSLVGENTDGSDNVRCLSEVTGCCNDDLLGDWYEPDGDRLLFRGDESHNIYESRYVYRAELRRRNNADSPTGLYHCDISYDASNPPLKVRFIVGIYINGGGSLTISSGITLNVISDLNGPTPRFTLTCISTGGPATTVSWTRDSTILTDGNVTVLNDKQAAQYTHTLTVAGRHPGLYTCSVSNNKPSTASKHFTIQVASPPTGLVTNTENNSTILFSWMPPSPLGYTNGYKITLVEEETSVSHVFIANDGSTNSYLLTGLSRGNMYTLSIVGLSIHFRSDTVSVSLNSVLIYTLTPSPTPVPSALPPDTRTDESVKNGIISNSTDIEEDRGGIVEEGGERGEGGHKEDVTVTQVEQEDNPKEQGVDDDIRGAIVAGTSIFILIVVSVSSLVTLFILWRKMRRFKSTLSVSFTALNPPPPPDTKELGDNLDKYFLSAVCEL